MVHYIDELHTSPLHRQIGNQTPDWRTTLEQLRLLSHDDSLLITPRQLSESPLSRLIIDHNRVMIRRDTLNGPTHFDQDDAGRHKK